MATRWCARARRGHRLHLVALVGRSRPVNPARRDGSRRCAGSGSSSTARRQRGGAAQPAARRAVPDSGSSAGVARPTATSAPLLGVRGPRDAARAAAGDPELAGLLAAMQATWEPTERAALAGSAWARGSPRSCRSSRRGRARRSGWSTGGSADPPVGRLAGAGRALALVRRGRGVMPPLRRLALAAALAGCLERGDEPTSPSTSPSTSTLDRDLALDLDLDLDLDPCARHGPRSAAGAWRGRPRRPRRAAARGRAGPPQPAPHRRRRDRAHRARRLTRASCASGRSARCRGRVWPIGSTVDPTGRILALPPAAPLASTTAARSTDDVLQLQPARARRAVGGAATWTIWSRSRCAADGRPGLLRLSAGPGRGDRPRPDPAAGRFGATRRPICARRRTGQPRAGGTGPLRVMGWRPGIDRPRPPRRLLGRAGSRRADPSGSSCRRAIARWSSWPPGDRRRCPAAGRPGLGRRGRRDPERSRVLPIRCRRTWPRCSTVAAGAGGRAHPTRADPALDRRGIAAGLLGGAPLLSGPFVPGDPDADPRRREPFDPPAAARLLAGGCARPTLSGPGRLADDGADRRRLGGGRPRSRRARVDEVPYSELLDRGRGGRLRHRAPVFTSGPDLDLCRPLSLSRDRYRKLRRAIGPVRSTRCWPRPASRPPPAPRAPPRDPPAARRAGPLRIHRGRPRAGVVRRASVARWPAPRGSARDRCGGADELRARVLGGAGRIAVAVVIVACVGWALARRARAHPARGWRAPPGSCRPTTPDPTGRPARDRRPDGGARRRDRRPARADGATPRRPARLDLGRRGGPASRCAPSWRAAGAPPRVTAGSRCSWRSRSASGWRIAAGAPRGSADRPIDRRAGRRSAAPIAWLACSRCSRSPPVAARSRRSTAGGRVGPARLAGGRRPA